MKTQTNIRLVATVGVIGLVLSACGTSPVNQSQNQRVDDYQQQARVAKQAISEAPEWMSRLPKESGVIYENGTAISSDFSMADLKAKTMAYVKICTSAGGKVRSQMKMYRADTDAASIEKSELTVRSLCPDVDITGVETVEMKHVSEGNRIRTYVLVALPLGSKNIARSTKDIQNNSGAAFKDLDGITREQLQGAPKEPVNGASKEVTTSPGIAPAQAPATALPPVSQIQATPESAITPIEIPTLKMNVKPATKIDGSMMDSVKAVGPDSVVVETTDGVQKQLGLVESKNPEYVARRAQALNKPGAVIGQVSVE
jgi:type II secretory pathway pseudopilin PulG